MKKDDNIGRLVKLQKNCNLIGFVQKNGMNTKVSHELKIGDCVFILENGYHVLILYKVLYGKCIGYVMKDNLLLEE